MKRVLVRALLPLVCAFGWLLFSMINALQRKRKPERLGKVLVIKLWAIGEVVMATPVLEALKRHYPDCTVHILVGKTSLPVVENNPFCDKVIPIEEDIFLRLKIRQILRLARDLKREGYDTAIVLHQFFLFGVFAWLAGIPVRAGIDRRGEGFALTVKAMPSPKPIHRVQENLSVVGALGVKTEGLAARIWLAPEALERAGNMLKEAGCRGGKVVVMLPTGGQNAPAATLSANIVTKRWPVELYAELARRLTEEWHCVIVLGGAAETGLEVSFKDTQASVMIGKTDLATTIGLIGRADAVVTNDSGPMHIAAALGRPMVAIFGPTDSRILGYQSEKAVILTSNTECSPCYREDLFPGVVPECEHQKCMRSVTVEMVHEAVRRLLEGAAGHAG